MTSTYQEVLSKVQTLSHDEQYKLLQQLMIFFSKPVKDSKQKNILELQRLGKEISLKFCLIWIAKSKF